MKTVVRCGTFIDGTGHDPLLHVAVVIEDGMIVTIDESGRHLGSVDLEVDASAATVMPGMIDCHVHLHHNGEGPAETMETSYSLSVAHMLANARTTLEAGFTSVRDAGGTTKGVKTAIERGLFPGPRLRIAVNWLSQTGGHGDFTLPGGANIWGLASVERPSAVADGIDGVRRATRELLRAGADQVKIMTTGGVSSPSDEPTATGFSPEEIATVVYEAHAAGKPVLAHAQGAQGIKNAVRARVASIEHGMYLDEEGADEMVAAGTFYVPTLVAPISILRKAERDPGSVPSYAARKAAEVVQVHQGAVRLALEKGVRIAMGTDSGVGPHGSNAEELELMVTAGLTPMEAIVATTRTAAQCLRLGEVTGTLQVGMRADLLAVAGNPLDDIGILRDHDRIKLIMKDGDCAKNQLSAG